MLILTTSKTPCGSTAVSFESELNSFATALSLPRAFTRMPFRCRSATSISLSMMVSMKNMYEVTSFPASAWSRSKAIRFRNMYSVVSSTTRIGSRSTPPPKETSPRLCVRLFMKRIPASWSSVAERMISSSSWNLLLRFGLETRVRIIVCIIIRNTIIGSQNLQHETPINNHHLHEPCSVLHPDFIQWIVRASQLFNHLIHAVEDKLNRLFAPLEKMEQSSMLVIFHVLQMLFPMMIRTK
ncbi:uncharacterized protein LOC128197750 [Vigna angularis]|uniref:uncharacterized protein LOC128197750 n=1 Tax=Phaseolus angularis TaxID=3914 RepID=UPI0022B52D3A|nr:uncharacterized protein LOC128197750 [Vigna angularis]